MEKKNYHGNPQGQGTTSMIGFPYELVHLLQGSFHEIWDGESTKENEGEINNMTIFFGWYMVNT